MYKRQVKQTVDSDKNPDEVLSVERSGDVVKLGTDITVKVARTPSQTATVTITPPPPPTDTTTDTGTSPPPTP